jgi:hypothetical protein
MESGREESYKYREILYQERHHVMQVNRVCNNVTK